MAESISILKKVYDLFGVDDEATKLNQEPKESTRINRPIHISQYSEAELRNLPGLNKEVEKQRGSAGNQLNAQDFIGYLSNASLDNRNIIRELKGLKDLAPEIEQSKRIMVSSIMSPNDMQTGLVNVSVEVPDLNEEANGELTKFLNNFFNDDLKLGKRMTRWIGSAMFETGSAPITVMPRWNLDILNAAVDREIERTGINNPYENSISGVPGFASLVDDPTQKLLSSLTSGMEGLTDPNKITDEKTRSSMFCEEAIEQLSIMEEFKDFKQEEVEEFAIESLNAASTLIQSHKSFILTHSNAAQVLQTQLKHTSEAGKKATEEIDKYLFGDSSTSVSMMVLKTEGELDNKDHPAVIEFPAESVIPVCVPGSITEHVGYFVLVDQYGAPISNRIMDQVSTFGSRRLVQSTVDAAYGKPIENIMGNKLSYAQRFAAVSTIFGITLKNMMSHKLDTLGFRGHDISQHEAISNCMLQHFLQRKKVALIFVPNSLMCYYCFANRDDGTGKAIIEDMRMVIALRTTLVIAGIMAAMRNAMDNRTIEVSVDEKNASFEQTCDMIRNIYTEKRMLRFDNNPQSVARDIINKSLTIIPKNIKGIPNDMVSRVENTPNQSPLPDESLLERLSNWGISMIGIPPTALNATNETEYSRSIATNNIFFSNNIRGYQATAVEATTKFVRLYLKYSKILQRRIQEILEVKGTTTGTEDMSASTSDISTIDSIKNEKNLTKNINDHISQVIQNTNVSLPSPNIAASKAQIEEIRAYMEVIDQLTTKLFSDDLVSAKDPELKPVMVQIRALVQLQMIREYVKRIGLAGMIEIPGFEDIDQAEIQSITQTIINIRNMNVKTEAVLNPEPSGTPAGDGGFGGGSSPMETPEDDMSGLPPAGDEMNNPPTEEAEQSGEQPPDEEADLVSDKDLAAQKESPEETSSETTTAEEEKPSENAISFK